MNNSTSLHLGLSTGPVSPDPAHFRTPDAARMSGAEGGSALGNHARCSSASSPSDSFVYNRISSRFALQSVARELIPDERVALCLRRPIPLRTVDVLYSPARCSAHYGGLQVCASVWHCPVCAAKISERRRIELTSALSSWSNMCSDHQVLLVTFTLQHHRGEGLKDVLASLKEARTRLVSGRASKDFATRYGVAGMVRSLEVTYGDNGWHPHIHVLYFLDNKFKVVGFEEEIKQRWSVSVSKAGGSASLIHGCDVRFGDTEAAHYVAKWGKDKVWTAAHELSKAPVKRGRRGGFTPMEMLSAYLDGDQSMGRQWKEYARVFKGERQMHWSHGLRKHLGLGQEKQDSELVTEQDEIAVILASLSSSEWRVVVANDARGELLHVARSGDPDQVRDFLVSLGVGI